MKHGIYSKDSQGLIDAAFEFAKNWHEGQKRKYTKDDYIVHPVEVAQIVSSVTDDVIAICCAFLHDVLEDTKATKDDFIACGLGFMIYESVLQITDVSKPEDGNRKVRKEIDRKHIANCSPRVATVKLADLISNSKSIIDNDPKFAKVYIKEKKALLEVLKHGNVELYGKAKSIIDNYELNILNNN